MAIPLSPLGSNLGAPLTAIGRERTKFPPPIIARAASLPSGHYTK